MADRNRNEPVMLELAHLPREQIGPFLLLGLDKDDGKEEIEAHWADRLKWARKQLISTPLEDINWARELIRDPERRIAADVASFNADTADNVLGQLARRYGVGEARKGPSWEPLDEEKPLADYQPPVEVPDAAAVRASVAMPELPREAPAAARFLDDLARVPLDPWSVRL
jgi:hypothetical protein